LIITEQKPFDEIKNELKDYKNIVIFGCGRCCTSCATGGDDQVADMKKKLEKIGKKVLYTSVIEAPCDERLVRLELNKIKDIIDNISAILVMSCGGGVSAINELISIPTIPALNALFLGVAKRLGVFEERCSMCGDCVLEKTMGICPVTRCSKGLLNGPCGGSSEGKCEVDPEKDCAWALIFDRLKKAGKLDNIKVIWDMKDYKLSLKPRKVDRRQK